MAKNFIQEGDVLDWTNSGTAVASGEPVVIGGLVGVALTDIPALATGSVALEGVFEVPKVSAAVIAQGEYVTFDISEGAFDDNAAVPAAGDVEQAAVAWQAAGAGATTLLIKLTGQPGTVAAGA